MRSPNHFVSAATTALLMVLAGPAIAAADDTLAFVESDPLVVAFSSPAAAPTALVAIRNNGDTAAALTVSLLLGDGATSADGIVEVTGDPTTVEAHEVAWVTLTFTAQEDLDALDGYLVATADLAGPATRPIQVVLDQRVIGFAGGSLVLSGSALPGGPGAVLGIAVTLAMGLIVLKGLANRFRLASKVGSPKWGYDSWASTVTAVGAVLGTVLGAGFFPVAPNLLSVAQFAGLNVLAGMLVIGAPFLYQTLAHSDGTGNAPILLVAAAVSFTAVFTELLTLMLAVSDAAASVGSTVVSTALLATGLVLIVLTLWYGWQALSVGFAGPRPQRMAGARYEPKMDRTRDINAPPVERPDERGDWKLF